MIRNSQALTSPFVSIDWDSPVLLFSSVFVSIGAVCPDFSPRTNITTKHAVAAAARISAVIHMKAESLKSIPSLNWVRTTIKVAVMMKTTKSMT